MISHCPSHDWDRYCAQMEAPYPAGKPRLVRSKQPHHCASCYGKIEAGTPHLMQPMLSGDEGLFCGAERLHVEGECLPPPKDWWE